eukprot:gene24119-9692_t
MAELIMGMSLTSALAVASTTVLFLSLLLLFIRKDSKSSVSSKVPATKRAAARQSIEEDPNKPLVRLLYGTQTGTAERFCKQISKDIFKKYGNSTTVKVMDIENYVAADKLSKEKVVIFCMATYGDGEPTDNANAFFTWLLKSAEEVEAGEREPFLDGVNYGVFGLGNKQYEHFNAVGKRVFKALGTLGAHPLLRRGDGDDDACIDDDFDKWCGDFYTSLETRPELVGEMQVQTGEEPAAPILAYDVKMLADDSSVVKDVLPFSKKGGGYTAHSPVMANINRVQELHTPKSDRSCVHVEIDMSSTDVKYETGDHVAVFPQNSEAVVAEVAALLGLDLNSAFKMTRPAGLQLGGAQLDEPPFTGPLSVRTALAYFVDVLSSPRKDALLALAAHATDAAQAERLKRLGSHAGGDEYLEYVSKPHRSLIEIMKDFSSSRPPLGVFFGSVAPRLQPRFYSISSSNALHPSSVHVTCAVVKEQTPTGRIHEGVCSTWFKRHGQDSPVPVYIRHSHFKLPASPTTPIIMVGPGTGLAPFRGFLQERAAQLDAGAKLGPAILFFGCRNREHDYIYEEELKAYAASGALTNLHVAFSRESGQKVYVQHMLQQEASALWPLLADQNAHMYVCGDAKHMAKDVHHALHELVQQGKGCSSGGAEAFVKEMQDAGRYQRDVW